MSELLEQLKNDLHGYQCIPFWSWNDRLEPEELRRQIRLMKQQGIGGFFMHARGGLQTEYLSDEWFRAVEACIDEAEKQGMDAWCYDENGWPSGFAGMKLLEDPANLAHYLTCEKKAAFDEDALAVYTLSGDNLTRVSADTGADEYICLYDRTNASVVDVCNPDIVRKFLDETHEKYYARFKGDFGRAMKGFFTDEPQYFRWDTAYTPVILDVWQEKYHEDLLDTLGALFVDCRQSATLRWRYWRLMNRLFVDGFARQVYEWCEEHDCMLTGHAVEESRLHTQMWCCAGVMPFYEYEHIPGIDWLGREIGTEMSPRQVSSVSQQLGRRQVLTETFACSGWDVTPAELRRIALWQYVNGVNLMCQHLYPYSIRGQRKRDYPAFYSEHNPWIRREFREFNDYFTTLGYMLAESSEHADVAIIHPMHSAYLTYNRTTDAASVQELQDAFTELIERMGAACIGHHYIDESLLERHGSVDGDRLVMGKRSYRTVVIPEMACLDRSTVELLRDFAANGGKIRLAGKRPWLIDGADAGDELAFMEAALDLDELRDDVLRVDQIDTPVRTTMRHSEFGDFFLAVNLSKTEICDVKYTMQGKGARLFDPQTREYSNLYWTTDGETVTVPLHFRPGDAYVVFRDDAAEVGEPSKDRGEEGVTLATAAVVTAMDENSLTLDRAQMSRDGVSYTDVLPIPGIADMLLKARRNEPVWLRYTFRVDELPASLILETENWKTRSVTLNGTPISLTGQGQLDRSFVRCDILNLVRVGENELIFELDYYQSPHVYYVLFDCKEGTESLMNCLSYDTDIESIYLRGRFRVTSDTAYIEGPKGSVLTDGGFAVTAEQDALDLAHINLQGYPFFAGSVTAELDFDVEETGYKLRLNGRFAAAELCINGSSPIRLLFEDTVDVSHLLKPGRNHMRLTLTNSNRNLMGPFHYAADPEPYGVGPATFTLPGSWENGRSKQYRDSYAFVDFGVTGLDLIPV